ncbi:unnamed protein product [Nesidiocoris tenuis]|uniref:Uncharacterized protein n=1 Tax=Nesidiocoris tenuis TaxID=355587 RepID=A0A6H5HRG0_9HEMI|nr:unnamed protein product [Nesidiocoris tenuis]
MKFLPIPATGPLYIRALEININKLAMANARLQSTTTLETVTNLVSCEPVEMGINRSESRPGAQAYQQIRIVPARQFDAHRNSVPVIWIHGLVSLLVASLMILGILKIPSLRAIYLTNKLPGPRCWPIVGYLITYYSVFSKDPGGLITLVGRQLEEYGGFFSSWTFGSPSCITCDPDVIKVIRKRRADFERAALSSTREEKDADGEDERSE